METSGRCRSCGANLTGDGGWELCRGCLLRAGMGDDVTGSLPPSDDPTTDRPISNATTEGAGSRIGPYRLLQQIGEGGMGTVFMAEQEQPVRRRVALKIIKPGMDTGQVVARFEAERQALALMDHQNIARVLDAGATASGRPYFVMELVNGVEITKYCDDAKLTPRERLELFIPVCRAIQHAHQKGIIHRDIKPSNVLVTLHDGRPVPKVIDFGIAKATEQKLTERTMFTQFGALVGTLEYMSPEQAEISALGVDTRSDIYSLGVLLYELLTGSTPLERARLRGAGFAEILRRIKEEEPPRPSTRLSDSAETLATVAASRGSEPSRLTRLIRGELDWIVMRALEKDRTRRYDSAAGFARDVERYLADEEVEACPPSRAYRLRKFSRRYRVALTTASAFALLLTASAAVSTWLAARANDALAQATKAKAGAEIALKNSERARTQAEAIRDLLVDAFRRPSPEVDGRALKMVDLLGGALARLEKAVDVAPAIKGSLLTALGRTYLGLGLIPEAVKTLEKAVAVNQEALGPDHVETLRGRGHLAIALCDSGRSSEAVDRLEAIFKASEATLADDEGFMAFCRNNLVYAYGAAGRHAEAAKVSQVNLEAIERRYGPDHPATLAAKANHAHVIFQLGGIDESMAIFKEVFSTSERVLGPDHPTTLAALNGVATARSQTGADVEAIGHFEAVLKGREATLGPDHPDTLSSRYSLALALSGEGRDEEAVVLYRSTLERMATVLGPEHPITMRCRNGLATAYWKAKRLDLSIPLFEELLPAQRAKLGPDHPETVTTLYNLAVNYRDQGRTDEAAVLFEDLLKRKLPPNFLDSRGPREALSKLLFAQRRFDQALPLYDATYREALATHGPTHVTTLLAERDLAQVLIELGRYEEAKARLKDVLAGLASRPAQDPLLIFTKQIVVNLAFKQKDHATLEPFLADDLEAIRRGQGASSVQAADMAAVLGTNLLAQGKWAEAGLALADCLAIRVSKQPDHWSTFNARSLLGASLLGQKKFSEAEPLIVSAYEGLKAREAKIPPQPKVRLPEAAARVVQLYEAWDKQEKASEWRTKLEIKPDTPVDISARP